MPQCVPGARHCTDGTLPTAVPSELLSEPCWDTAGIGTSFASTTLLVLDVLLNCAFRNMTSCSGVVGARPQRGHPRNEVRKFLPQHSTACAFKTVHHFCHASSRVCRHKQMNIVGHNFHGLDEHSVLLRCGLQNVFQSLLDITHKNLAAILRAKD